MPERVALAGVNSRASLKNLARPFLLTTLMTAALILVLTWPGKLALAPQVSSGYTSYASLLLPPEVRFQMARIFATTANSPLDMWLSSGELFNQFLERRQIQQKTMEKLRHSHPEMVSSCKYARAQLGLVSQGNQMTSDQSFQQEQTVEEDFVRSESTEDSGRAQTRRANRIYIMASGNNPESAELLARLYAQTLQSELEEVSTRRVRTQRASIEKYLAMSKKRELKAAQRLKRWQSLEPKNLSEQEQQIQSLHQDKTRLESEILRIEQQIQFQSSNEEVRAAISSNPARTALDQLQQRLRLAEKTFLPQSDTVTRLRNQIPGLRKLAAQLEEDQISKETSKLSAELQIKRSRLFEVKERLGLLRQRIPDKAAVQKFATRQRELEAWTAEQLSWEQQLLQTRIEEQLCKGEGTAVLLLSPQPGKRDRVIGADLLTIFRRPLRFLPMAPLVSLILVCLAQLVTSALRIRGRAERFIDAPVLGELPRFQRSYQQSWLQRKYKGSGATREKPET